MKYGIQKILLLSFVTFTIQSQFNLQTVGYFIKFPADSPWGVWVSQEIDNNSGKSAILEGEFVGCLCCPSMKYGVSPWENKVSNLYNCIQSKKDKAIKLKSKLKNNCAIQSKPEKEIVDYAQYFKNIESFYTGIRNTLESLVKAYPNYSEGQGYLSSSYMDFCQSSLSRAITTKKVRVGSKNIVNSGQAIAAIKTVSGVGDVSGYFPENKFVVALDFTQLIGSSEEIKAAQKAALTTQTSTSTGGGLSSGGSSSNPFGDL